MTTSAEPGTVERLRAWAKGSLPLEAGIELLVRAFDGRFAHATQPWIRTESNGATWLDDQFLASSLGGLSGGERRVLTAVVALADSTGARRIDLVDIITGVDRENLALLLAAFAHAAGSHQQAELRLDPSGHDTQLSRLPTLHPWPSIDPAHQAAPSSLSTSRPTRSV